MFRKSIQAMCGLRVPVCASVILLALPGLASRASGAPDRIHFSREIRPILSDNCFACHGPDEKTRKAGLRLDLKEEALKELRSGGFAIVPGKPDQSELLRLIALPDDDDSHMPPLKTGKKVTAPQRAVLQRWIEEGAKWGEHWAYVVPVRPALPAARESRSANPIDRFVRAKLREEKLKPNPEADRATLIRRASLDLTGLPPAVSEVDAFLADKNPDACEKLVDRLLASPHHGERMAMAWLDAARFADTAGYHFDGFRQMHLWRDWVIKAFNDNKPFDAFTIEQIAGDLLPNASLEQKIATGFHRNVMTTDEGGVDPEEYLTKYQVDRVSTTAQVWLGTTMACAECHDHKYDPISTKEFYQFYAFFNGIPEKGLDGTRVRNPAPVLRVPTSEQGSELLRYLDLIPAAEKAQSGHEGELPKRQREWEKNLAAIKAPNLPGLLKEWSFENEGTNASASGLNGRALKLTGSTNESINAGQAVSLELTNAFSFGAWIKLHGPTGTVLSKMENPPGYRGFDLLISDRKVEVHLVHQFPDNAIKVVSKAALPTNDWTHVVVTYDGSKKAAGVTLFIDGRTNAVEISRDKLTASMATEAPLLIGSRPGAFPFHGLIDEIQFYDRALRTNEVADWFADAHLQIAARPGEERTPDQAEELKSYYRENLATEFLAARERVRQLQAEKKSLIDKIPDTMVMEEMEKPRDTHILIRGNYQSKGEKVTPGTPAFLPELPEGPVNRLALARWLVATNNPLTARVTVNRLWAMFFGTGLVKTANDFGSQGEQPSHPELLDWLACEFMAPLPGNGRTLAPWDVRHIVRLIVTSETYRQSARVTAEKLPRDPDNRLLSRGPRIRLDAELIRDNALAASGLLNAKIGGPSVKPYQPPGLWEITDHKFEPSRGEDLYRRGMYVLWKRAAHYPSFQAFDAPSREVCTVQRQRTSTPLQSLVLMNDPVFVEAARTLAARALQQRSTLRDQIVFAFRNVLARLPHGDELRVLENTFREHHERFTQDPSAAESLVSVGESPRPQEIDRVDLAAMTGVATVLLNLNETITR